MGIQCIDYIKGYRSFYNASEYEDEDKNDIVCDYIASMTDDYFIDLYHYLFKDGKHSVSYLGYF